MDNLTNYFVNVNYLSLNLLEDNLLYLGMNYVNLIPFIINSYNEKNKFLGHYLTSLDEYNKLFIYSKELF